jgi:hypothetical protein
MHTGNNSYGIITPKPNNITVHLPETRTYLHRFAFVHSESETLSA